MNVKNKELVVVRGINSEWHGENFSNLRISFGELPQTIPSEDAYYVGLYLEAPESKITHIGIVKSIDRYNNGADFNLKCIIKLSKPIDPGHPIRKHENWTLTDLGLNPKEMEELRIKLMQI